MELDFCKGPNKSGPKEEKGYQVGVFTIIISLTIITSRISIIIITIIIVGTFICFSYRFVIECSALKCLTCENKTSWQWLFQDWMFMNYTFKRYQISQIFRDNFCEIFIFLIFVWYSNFRFETHRGRPSAQHSFTWKLFFFKWFFFLLRNGQRLIAIDTDQQWLRMVIRLILSPCRQVKRFCGLLW